MYLNRTSDLGDPLRIEESTHARGEVSYLAQAAKFTGSHPHAYLPVMLATPSGVR